MLPRTRAAFHHPLLTGVVGSVPVPRSGRSAEALKGPRRVPVPLSWSVHCLVQCPGKEDAKSESKDPRGVDRSKRAGAARWLIVSVRRTDPEGGRRETTGKHSASTSARRSKRARGRGRSAGAGFRVRRGVRPLLRCARARPDARASLAGRPPATSRPGPSPHTTPPCACARTSTHVHVRVCGTSSPDSRDVTRLAPVRPSRAAKFTSQQRT